MVFETRHTHYRDLVLTEERSELNEVSSYPILLLIAYTRIIRMWLYWYMMVPPCTYIRSIYVCSYVELRWYFHVRRTTRDTKCTCMWLCLVNCLTGGCVFLPNNIFFPFWLEVLSCCLLFYYYHKLYENFCFVAIFIIWTFF